MIPAVAVPVVTVLLAAWSIQRFDEESADTQKRDISRWPDALRESPAEGLEDYRVMLETQVGNIVNAMHMECDKWRPSPHCGGKTNSGRARLWWLEGCGFGEGEKSCKQMHDLVLFQVDTLRGIEHKISHTAGYRSQLFVSTVVKVVHGAALAAVGRETDAFSLRVYHSEVPPDADWVPARTTALDMVASAVSPFLWTFYFVEAVPWVVHDFGPLDNEDDKALYLGVGLAAWLAVLTLRFALIQGGRWYFVVSLGIVMLAAPTVPLSVALAVAGVSSLPRKAQSGALHPGKKSD